MEKYKVNGAAHFIDKNPIQNDQLPRIFESVDVLNGNRPSRKDDLISLAYMIIYLIDGQLPFMNFEVEPQNQIEKFQFIHKLKQWM